MAICKLYKFFQQKKIQVALIKLQFNVFQNKYVFLFSLEETLHLKMLNILFLDQNIQVALINFQFYSVNKRLAKFSATFQSGIFLILFLATFLATFPKNLANFFFNLLVTLQMEKKRLFKHQNKVFGQFIFMRGQLVQLNLIQNSETMSFKPVDTNAGLSSIKVKVFNILSGDVLSSLLHRMLRRLLRFYEF